MLIEKTCINCTILFSRVVSKSRDEHTKFCSKQCLGEWTAKQRGWDGTPFNEKIYHQEWIKNNPEKVKIHNNKHWGQQKTKEWYKKYTQTKEYKLSRVTIRYKNRYGITEEEYNELYRLQNGLCAICGNPPKIDQRLYIDHNHKTRKVRALLCQGCNSGLGYFKENIILLSNAIAYIEKHSKEDD